MLKAIERGYVQQEIQNAAYEYQQKVDNKEAIVVGVNSFRSRRRKAHPNPAHRSRARAKQMERLRALRAKRDAEHGSPRYQA